MARRIREVNGTYGATDNDTPVHERNINTERAEPAVPARVATRMIGSRRSHKLSWDHREGGRQPTVDAYILPVDVARVVRSQEQNGIGDLCDSIVIHSGRPGTTQGSTHLGESHTDREG